MFNLSNIIPVDSNYSFMKFRKMMLIISSFLMIFSIFFKTFKPNGSHAYIPEVVCLIIDVLIINLCDIKVASEGVSFLVFKK